MEQSEVSQHEIAVYRALFQVMGTPREWQTSKDVAKASGVAPRTARAHLLKLVRLGLVDVAEVFPGHRYRLSAHAVQRNRAYVDRLARAAEALGIPLNDKEV